MIFSQIGKHCYSIAQSNSVLVIFFTIKMEKVTKKVIDSAKDKFPLSSGIERNLTSKKDGKANDRKAFDHFYFLRKKKVEMDEHARLRMHRKKKPNIYEQTDRSQVSTRRSDLTKSPLVYA